MSSQDAVKSSLRWRRVLLKLSGEAFSGDSSPIHWPSVRQIAQEIRGGAAWHSDRRRGGRRESLARESCRS